jgi:hypothetical protein
MQKIDPDQWQQRLDRITELFTGMVIHAEELSLSRCPYKDRNNGCTAHFGCRNQRRRQGELPLCVGDDKLNYRSAWETE